MTSSKGFSGPQARSAAVCWAYAFRACSVAAGGLAASVHVAVVRLYRAPPRAGAAPRPWEMRPAAPMPRDGSGLLRAS